MGLSDGLCLCIQCFAVLCLVGLVLMAMLRRMKIRNYGNKHVLITGCDTGFGYLLVKRLDSLGFKVFAGCLTETGVKRLKKECSNNVTVIEIDVSKKESVQRARGVVDKYLPKDKGLWAVVNNAGIAGPVAPTEWLTYEDFEQTIAVNLMGVIYVTKSFLPLVRKEEGRVINMASICGRIALATASYNASKFGVEGFTDTLRSFARSVIMVGTLGCRYWSEKGHLEKPRFLAPQTEKVPCDSDYDQKTSARESIHFRHELYKTGCSVSVIEPGFFSTGIVDDGTVKQGLDKRFEGLDDEAKQYYGTAYKDELVKQGTSFLSLVLSPHVYKVIDSYEHAITARFPKVRYTVGRDANIVFRFLMWVPDWFTDFVFGYLQIKPAAKC